MDLETSNIYPVGNIYLKLLKLSLFGWKWFANTTQSSALNSCKIKKKKKTEGGVSYEIWSTGNLCVSD